MGRLERTLRGLGEDAERLQGYGRLDEAASRREIRLQALDDVPGQSTKSTTGLRSHATLAS